MTNLSKSTVFRIIQTLEKHGLLTFDPSSNRYFLGIKLFEFGGIIYSSLSLRKAAPQFLDRLAAANNHLVLMGVMKEGELVYIDRREGKDRFIVTSEIGRRRPPHYGMLGKVLMAFLPEEKVDELLTRYPLEKIASRTITDPKKFKDNLKQIRRKGYSYGHNEVWDGAIGIGAPIRDSREEVVAAVGTAFAAFNMDDQRIKEIISLVVQTANEISAALGLSSGEHGRTSLFGKK